MFEEKQQQPQFGKTPGAGGAQQQPLAQSGPEPTAPGQQQSSAGGQRQIYTMPEKFMPVRRSKKGGNAKKWVLIVGVVLSFLAILAAIVVYAFLITSDPAPDNTNTGLTSNTNENTNETSNQNSNGNDNENSNQNSNSNDNENANTANGGIGSIINLNDNEDFLTVNDNENGNSNTNNNANLSPFPDKSDVASARDKDKDKLTDEEEELYGTRFDKPDTDKDGFIDGSEVINGFSPVDEDETLLNSGLVIQYENEDFGWTIDYPAQWFAEPVGADKAEVFFTPDTVEGEIVSVLVEKNPKQQTAAQWFASLYSDIDPGDLEKVTVAGLTGIVSPDGYTYYIADDRYIIGLVYNFGAKDKIHFKSTFEMMIRSFKYTEQKKKKKSQDDKETNSNTNSNSSGDSNSEDNTNSTNANSNDNTNEEA